MGMELQPEGGPPAYVSIPPESLAWASVSHQLPQRTPGAANITLPDLKTVLSPEFDRLSPTLSHDSQTFPGSPSETARSLPGIEAGFGDARRSMDSTVGSPKEAGSAMSEDRTRRSTSVVSMDDPDVRMAAEALSGLGNPGFVRASRASNTLGSPHASLGDFPHPVDVRGEPEPLLELIAQAHPWVGGTIKGSLSAYSTTKYYSPRIVQYGANLVERNITTPVFSAVSSVGEMTGVEHGIRRYLDARRPGEVDSAGAEGSANKRRHMIDSSSDWEQAYINAMPGMRRDSIESHTESLPAYGASRPPSYREAAGSPADNENLGEKVSPPTRPGHHRSWSSQIFVTTSGLSVALSTTSRRSLRYCLSLLGQQAQHVANLTTALSHILKEYEATRANALSQQTPQHSNAALEKGAPPRVATPDQNEATGQLAGAIKRHCDDIWQSLQYVVSAVSNYAGGALPENAHQFVRQQLMSLPQRWRVVSDGQQQQQQQGGGASETSRSAQRMIDFATEGLDMMTQVSGVLKATLDSAEKWLARVGSRDGEQHDHEMPDAQQELPPPSTTPKS